MKPLFFLFLLSVVITGNLLAQTKEKIPYHFDKAKTDTIKFADINENLELLGDDASNVVNGYDVKILIKKQFVILPINGNKLGTQLISVLKEIKPRPRVLEIENIVTTENGSEKKYKGFMLHIK